MNLLSRGKNDMLIALLGRKIFILPLEYKFHIFAPRCNMLYISH